MNHPTFRVVYAAKSLEEFRALMKEFPGLQNSQASTVNVSGSAKTCAPNGLDKGDNEKSYVAAYGRTRITDQVIALCGLTGNRESQFAKMKAMRDSGELVKTATGFQLADSGESVTVAANIPEDDGGDTFQ